MSTELLENSLQMESSLQTPSPQPSEVSPKACAEGGAIRFAAMNYLARREHSFLELRQKLTRRFPETDAVEAALRQLRDEGLQSDERFAESFTAARMRRGQGPLRIANELRLKGVAVDLCEAALDIGQDEWVQRATEVAEKKCGGIPSSMVEQGRLSRFLQYRGFSGDHIRRVLKRAKSGGE